MLANRRAEGKLFAPLHMRLSDYARGVPASEAGLHGARQSEAPCTGVEKSRLSYTPDRYDAAVSFSQSRKTTSYDSVPELSSRGRRHPYGLSLVPAAAKNYFLRIDKRQPRLHGCIQ